MYTATQPDIEKIEPDTSAFLPILDTRDARKLGSFGRVGIGRQAVVLRRSRSAGACCCPAPDGMPTCSAATPAAVSAFDTTTVSSVEPRIRTTLGLSRAIASACVAKDASGRLYCSTLATLPPLPFSSVLTSLMITATYGELMAATSTTLPDRAAVLLLLHELVHRLGVLLGGQARLVQVRLRRVDRGVGKSGAQQGHVRRLHERGDCRCARGPGEHDQGKGVLRYRLLRRGKRHARARLAIDDLEIQLLAVDATASVDVVHGHLGAGGAGRRYARKVTGKIRDQHDIVGAAARSGATRAVRGRSRGPWRPLPQAARASSESAARPAPRIRADVFVVLA